MLNSANKFSLFTASFHQKVNADVEVGAKAIWNQSIPNSNVGIEVGTKVTLDKSTFFKSKIDSAGRLGLGFTQNMPSGFKISFGGLFDTTNFAADVHKVGAQIVYEG
jgi:hypothetical protein